jgi:hypothetical protein
VVARALTGSPERTAWTVILGAFCTFVLLVATLLVGGRWWLQNASVEQGISLEPTGTVFVTRPGRSAPEVNLAVVPAGSKISTENTAQASLTFVSSDGKQVLATVKVFGGSVLEISQADSPRYPTGTAPNRINLHLTSGRVRATVGVDVTRRVQIIIQSDPGARTVIDQPGSNVSVQVDTSLTTMVTVRDGQATVSAQGTDVVLAKDTRAQVAPNSAPTGPLAAEQNLVKDGDFTQPLEGNWLPDPRPPADPAEEPGKAERTTVSGRRTVHIIRTGVNWGHAGITQVINRDVQGLTSLRLNMDIQIDNQDVLNCGQLGTECPLMVKISYIDVGGGAHEWLQGFYWFPDPNPSHGATYCVTCSPVQYKHILWPFGVWQTYTSDDLLQAFAAAGAPASTIRSITIYGEGHSFESYFTDVQLLANE